MALNCLKKHEIIFYHRNAKDVRITTGMIRFVKPNGEVQPYDQDLEPGENIV